jgi:FkbM family methyltransferase
LNSIKLFAKNVAYGALNLSTAGRGVRRTISGEEIRFPARWSRYYEQNYEPDTFSFLREHCHSGQTVFDVGAHIGLFSVVMAKLVGPTGQVYSFEPTPFTNSVLRETVRLNNVQSVVEVRAEAMSRTSGSATFYDTGDQGSNANSLVPSQRTQEGYSVPTVALDDFVGQRGLRMNCLKIDVEGAELEVLLGGQKTIPAFRPPTSLGLHPPFLGDSPSSVLMDIWKIVTEYGFTVCYHSKQVDVGWFCDQSILFDVHLLPR